MQFRINTPRVIYEIIDQEAIIIDFDTGAYYSLDEIGSEIWSLIEKGATVSQIIDVISNSYSGDHVEVADEVDRFITELKEENLIVSSSMDPYTESQEMQVESGDDYERPPFRKPALSKYSDMQELLLLDPIHEVDETGWPSAKAEPRKVNEESST